MSKTKYKVYGSIKDDYLLLTDENNFVINGHWQMTKKHIETIPLLGIVYSSLRDYNNILDKFIKFSNYKLIQSQYEFRD